MFTVKNVIKKHHQINIIVHSESIKQFLVNALFIVNIIYLLLHGLIDLLFKNM